MNSVSPSIKDVTTLLREPDRLKALNQLELLDTPADEAFDRLTQLASKILDTPVSLVSLVDADRQFFKSFFGLSEPWASKRETPLSHSFCQYVVATNQPLIVTDARHDPVLKDNLAVSELFVISYLGMPLTLTNGVTIGSFCVIDNVPRVWEKREIEIVRELAQSVMTEIELRVALRTYEKAAETQVNAHHQHVTQLTESWQSAIQSVIDMVQVGGDKTQQLEYLKQVQNQLKA